MSGWWDKILELAPAEFLGYFIAVVLGYAFAVIASWVYKFRLRKWRVELRYTADPDQFPEQTIVTRAISSSKVRELLSEPSDRALFVKGVVSPYGWIGSDPLETVGYITMPSKKWRLFWPKTENRILIIRPHKDKYFNPSNTLASLVPQPQPQETPRPRSQIRTDPTVPTPLIMRQKQRRHKPAA